MPERICLRKGGRVHGVRMVERRTNVDLVGREIWCNVRCAWEGEMWCIVTCGATIS